ncbi:MAG: tetratricopeptide repeat protein [Elusimicrobiaceae bacterium]|nr:tetratricopeptide repeat protein [Elusimicrobiaceae bacterium]
MGKKILITLLSFGLVTVGACLLAKELPVSKQGRQEAALYLEMLQGFLAENDQRQEGCSHYQKALSYSPDNKYIKRQLLVCAMEKNELEQAAQYADFINQEPNEADDFSVYAFYQWRRGEIASAQEYYQKALQLAPDDSRALYQYVVLVSSLDLDRAVALLQGAKSSLPDLSAALDYETGNLYRQHKNWQQALNYYQRALDQQPRYVEARLARAEIFEKLSRYFLMMHEFEELEKIGYHNAQMFSRMGSFYVLVKDEKRAKSYFLKAKEEDFSENIAGYFLAVFAEQEGDFLQAAKYLQETADYPKNAARWLQVSFYQQQVGEEQQALKTLEQAYQRFPQNVEIGYFYGLLLQDEKQYSRSAKVLKGVLVTNPDYENARLAYAFALDGCKKYKQMEEQVRLILAKNPQHPAANNLLGFSLADRNTRLEEAEQLVTKAVTAVPTDRSYIDSLAWVYYRQHKYPQALQLLNSLDEEFILENPDAAYHLGAVYAALGENEKAIFYLQQAAATQKPAAKLLRQLKKK